MKRKLIASILTLGAVLFLMAGCSSTAGNSESDLAKASMKNSCAHGQNCGDEGCENCTNTIYTAKDRPDSTYK